MNHFWEIVLIALVLILAILVVVICTMGTSTFDDEDWEVVVYCVDSGESLWSIGEEHCPDAVDIREWINRVQALNEMPNGNLRAGQKILIYVLAGED